MKIGCFIDLFHPYMLGGIEQRWFKIAEKLISYGDEITIFTTSLVGIRPKDKLYHGKLNIIREGIIKNPLSYRNKLSFMTFAFSSYKFLDVLDQFDIIDFHQYCGLQGEFLTRLKPLPHVITIHDLTSRKRSILHMIEKLIINLHQKGKIITVSSSVKKKLIRNFKVDPEKIIVIPNGIDFQIISNISKKYRKKSFSIPFKLIYVGRIVRTKNVGHLIKAIKNLEIEGYDVTLDIIGLGHELNSLIELSHKLGISDRINFLGFISDKLKVYEYMAKADLFVSASTLEGFGISLLESLATGTPIVAYNLDAYKEFIQNYYNGLLVEPGNIKKIAENIKKIIEDKSLWSKLINNGIKVARKHDLNRIVAINREVYLEVIQEWNL